jgi:hypothetical protein
MMALMRKARNWPVTIISSFRETRLPHFSKEGSLGQVDGNGHRSAADGEAEDEPEGEQDIESEREH